MGSFLCLLPEGDAVDALARLSRPAVDGIRYEPAERLHITLRYFGDVDEPTLDALIAVAAEVASLVEPQAIELGPATERLGRDGTLVVPAHGAEHIATLVDQVLATTGVAAWVSERAEHFYGHLTIARLRHGASVPDELLGAAMATRFVATRLHLIDSLATDDGRRYHHVADELLRG